jgi:hypothetical protein
MQTGFPIDPLQAVVFVGIIALLGLRAQRA